MVQIPGVTPDTGYEPHWVPGLVQGDFDCDGDIDSIDVLQVLVYSAQLPRIGDPCGPLGNKHHGVWFGDLNCAGGHADAADALIMARWLAQFPLDQPKGCTEIDVGI